MEGLSVRTVVTACALLICATASVSADTWPSKSIRAIVPFGAGSAVDVVPRLVFDQLSKQLGQSIIVENRGGAGGTIGAAAVAKADADGYTMLVHSSAHTIAPALFSNLSYDVNRDFVTVAVMGSVPNVMIIAPSKGFKTAKDYVAHSKANPTASTYASLGVGSAVHMSAERFRLSAGFNSTNIPFKGGAAALSEIIAGRVDFYFCPIATSMPHIKAGRLLGLAVSSPQRASALPDIPTTLELGFPQSDYSFWMGVFMPAKTPPEIVAKLGAEIRKALESPDVKAKFAGLGVEIATQTPAQFDEQVKKEVVTYGEFVKTAGLKVN
jgi:tripartite-type tricarboxylate transporter receptor subunit TctC